MPWYAAHLVMLVKLKEKAQTRFPLWENIVLIRAVSEDQAFAKAEERGRDAEGDDDESFTWSGQPATWVFAGVRKITHCEEHDERPGDGTEITFLEFEAQSLANVKKLLAGKEVPVLLTDQFAASQAGTAELTAKNGRARKRA